MIGRDRLGGSYDPPNLYKKRLKRVSTKTYVVYRDSVDVARFKMILANMDLDDLDRQHLLNSATQSPELPSKKDIRDKNSFGGDTDEQRNGRKQDTQGY